MAYGNEVCSCGHTQVVHGANVRRGQTRQSQEICDNCKAVIAGIKGESRGMGIRPFNKIPGTPTLGMEFSYGVSWGLDYTVKCKILAVEEKGGEFLGNSPKVFAGAGKKEYDWSPGALRANFSPKSTMIKMEVDVGIPSLDKFVVEKEIY